MEPHQGSSHSLASFDSPLSYGTAARYIDHIDHISHLREFLGELTNVTAQISDDLDDMSSKLKEKFGRDSNPNLLNSQARLDAMELKVNSSPSRFNKADGADEAAGGASPPGVNDRPWKFPFRQIPKLVANDMFRNPMPCTGDVAAGLNNAVLGMNTHNRKNENK